jgi:hypothetical protein
VGVMSYNNNNNNPEPETKTEIPNIDCAYCNLEINLGTDVHIMIINPPRKRSKVMHLDCLTKKISDIISESGLGQLEEGFS